MLISIVDCLAHQIHHHNRHYGRIKDHDGHNNNSNDIHNLVINGHHYKIMVN
ncbi:hypothetical protein BLA29_015170, partial [Euroglyphus maynei]